MSNVIVKPRHFWSAGSNRIRDVFRLAYLFAMCVYAILILDASVVASDSDCLGQPRPA